MKPEKYYWIKLFTNFFKMPEIDWLKEQENGCKYIVLYLQLCCLTANSDGKLVRQVGQMLIPYEAKKIAEVTNFDIDTVIIGLSLYQKCGLIYEEVDEILTISNVQGMVGRGSTTSWADYKRKQRAAAKEKETELKNNCPIHKLDNFQNEKLDIVQTLSKKCPDRDIEIKSIEYRDKEIEKEDTFQQFWDYYPKTIERLKEETKQIFNVYIELGISPIDLIYSAKNYSKIIKSKGIDDKYIKFPNNFLLEQRFLEYVPTYQENCPICKGVGSITKTEDDGRMQVYLCSCRNRFDKILKNKGES